MSPVEEEYSFSCPYCDAEMSIQVDCTAGRRQAFSYDCETCCQPIAIKIEIQDGEITGFSAEQES